MGKAMRLGPRETLVGTQGVKHRYAFGDVRTPPWIGRFYAKGLDGNRILIVGDSHYSKHGPIVGKRLRSLTRDSIHESQIDQDYPARFYTSISASLLGRLPDPGERAALWQSIAFYNYIQTSVFTGPGKPLTYEMLAQSFRLFLKVVEVLQPSVVMLYSYRIWNFILEAMTTMTTPFAFRRTGRHRAVLSIRGDVIAFISLPHASRAFSYKDWHPYIQRILRIVSRRRSRLGP
jgi:hypothetical protein